MRKVFVKEENMSEPEPFRIKREDTEEQRGLCSFLKSSLLMINDVMMH